MKPWKFLTPLALVCFAVAPFTASAQEENEVVVVDFSEDKDPGGWTANNITDARVENGRLSGISEADPYFRFDLTSERLLGLHAEQFRTVRVRYFRSSGQPPGLSLYWSTSKFVAMTNPANRCSNNAGNKSGVVTLDFDMSSQVHWSGILKCLRVDFPPKVGRPVGIISITLVP